jgi:hypothetical protein
LLYTAGFTENVLFDPSSSVYPSGFALLAIAGPMVPPAPGRLSTTTVLPHSSVKCCATMRLTTSVKPPGANGTIMRTGRSG